MSRGNRDSNMFGAGAAACSDSHRGAGQVWETTRAMQAAWTTNSNQVWVLCGPDATGTIGIGYYVESVRKVPPLVETDAYIPIRNAIPVGAISLQAYPSAPPTAPMVGTAVEPSIK